MSEETSNTARVFIYTLADPRDHAVRYVGKALDINVRFKGHLIDGSETYKTHWIRSLRKQGLKPEIEVLEEIISDKDETWQEAERFWIESLRFLGCRLTNLATGGIGGSKHSKATLEKMRQAALLQSPEKRARISATKTGVPMSEEAKAKLRIAHANPSAETRANMRAAMLGKKRSAESRAKQSATLKAYLSPASLAGLRIGWGRKHTESERAKVSAALKGKPFSPQHCQRISAVAKARFQDPEYRKKWSERTKAIMARPEVREKISAALIGKPAQPWSASRRAKIVAALTGRKYTPEHCQAISDGKRRAAENRKKVAA